MKFLAKIPKPLLRKDCVIPLSGTSAYKSVQISLKLLKHALMSFNVDVKFL